MTSTRMIAMFVGLSIPVIGEAGALPGESAPDTLLGFAIVVGAGVALSG
jgi:hypothetical protein